MAKRNQSFFRHAVLYGLGSALVTAGNVVLTPLYTRCLSKADYGALEVLGRCAEMTATVLLIGGLRQALLTYYQQSKSDAERAAVFRTTMGLLLTVCLVGGGAVMALAGPLGACFRGGDGTAVGPDLIRLALLSVLLESGTLMGLALLQTRLESAAYMAVTVGQFVARLLLCVVLVVVLRWGAAGVWTATAAATGAFGIGLNVREWLRRPGGLDWDKALGMLRFALPFLPGGLCFFILQFGDRLFLWYCRGPDEVAVYGLGYKVALAVMTFSATPLYMVWGARMYKAAEESDASRVFGRMFTRILAAFLLVGLAACLFQDEAAAVLGGAAYAGAAAVVAPVVAAGFFQTAAALMDAGFYVRRRTGLKFYITLAATVVILILYAVLIPPYGAMGAALATVGGFAFLAFCTWRVSQRIFPVEYEWGRLIDLTGLAAGLWLASRFLPEAGWVPVAAKAGLWLSWPLLVWVCGVPSAEEQAYLWAGVRQALARLWREPIPAGPPAAAADSGVIPAEELEATAEIVLSD